MSMKYCPTCSTRYDEEIIRFCIKDGTPLLEEDEPNFVEMPSENVQNADDEDDVGDETVIRRNIPIPPDRDDPDEVPRQRIVVPTAPEAHFPRANVIPPYQPPPRQANTAKVVFLTIIGTIAVLAVGAAGFWLLQNDRADNTNVNFNVDLMNANTNLNTNLGLDSNFNFNVNANFNTNSSVNVNSNTNANVRTPTPTPTPTPRPSPTATASPSPTPTRTPAEDNRTPTPTRTPVPTPTPIIIIPGQTPPANRG